MELPGDSSIKKCFQKISTAFFSCESQKTMVLVFKDINIRVLIEHIDSQPGTILRLDTGANFSEI